MTAFDVLNLQDLKAWGVDHDLITKNQQLSPTDLIWLHQQWQDRIFAETDHWCREPVTVSIG